MRRPIERLRDSSGCGDVGQQRGPGIGAGTRPSAVTMIFGNDAIRALTGAFS